jgi:malic enzyme
MTTECKCDPELSLEGILKKNHGLFDIKIKVSIRDTEGLSLAYTPGVATPCLEIQKDLAKAYEQTNKSNNVLILTDSSKFCNPEKKCCLLKKTVDGKTWNNNASMVYLEAFTAYYKCSTNLDAYPMILDLNLIKDAETLLDTVNAVALSFSGVELFGVCPKRVEEFKALFEKLEKKPEYAFLDTNKKLEIDEMLETKKTFLTSNAVVSAVWRVALDCHIFGDLEKLLNHVVEEIKSDKIDLTKGGNFECDLVKVVDNLLDYVFAQKLDNHTYDKYNWRQMELSKCYVIKKLKHFFTYGSKAWVEDIPKGYYMHKHTIPENSVLMHVRNRGVIEVGPKLRFCPKKFKCLFKWENLDGIAEKIVDNPELVFELTCKNNFGAIVTNGTAILGLGDIGALAGMPVMEGKSVLFKYFGGTNICPVCIQEKNVDKLIAYVQRIAPTYAIINLEDIKGPDCFTIENKLIETVECPMFHDDQHGTACVVLAGLINATRLRGSKPEEMKIVMNGAGAAGIAVSSLLIHYGYKNFIVCDTKGAIYKGRKEGMNPFKEKIAEITNKDCVKGKLCDVLKGADVVIGLSGPNTISKEDVKLMNPKPIVFALANPTPEIFPKDAFEAGAYIVATGRSDFPNQINNSLVFPGLFRATVDTRAPKITMEMKIAAGEAIANLVSKNDLRTDFIMPSALDVMTSVIVATDVAKLVIEKGLTNKKNIDIDKLRENIHSFFIDEKLTDVDQE